MLLYPFLFSTLPSPFCVALPTSSLCCPFLASFLRCPLLPSPYLFSMLPFPLFYVAFSLPLLRVALSFFLSAAQQLIRNIHVHTLKCKVFVSDGNAQDVLVFFHGKAFLVGGQLKEPEILVADDLVYA